MRIWIDSLVILPTESSGEGGVHHLRQFESGVSPAHIWIWYWKAWGLVGKEEASAGRWGARTGDSQNNKTDVRERKKPWQTAALNLFITPQMCLLIKIN